MINLYVHYRPSDGEILAWETAVTPIPTEGCDCLKINDHSAGIDPRLHRVDTEYLVLVDKSEEERRFALIPTEHEIKSAIYLELLYTDGFVVVDRPIDDEVREKWRVYRQTLRDLSKLNGPVEMIESWPIRPNETDAIPQLRLRIPENK